MPQHSKTHSPVHRWTNPVELPNYFVSEAAHYLRLPVSTVRYWVMGSDYPTGTGKVRSTPLVRTADPEKQLLSFLNLVELHVLASIRRVHRLKLKPVRRAISFLSKEFGSKHPLLDQKMLTDGQDLFVEKYGQFINISEQGQMHLKEFLAAYLRRIEWDEKHIPIRLFPFSRPSIDSPQLVAIDPRIRAGKPCIAGTGIPTSMIAERHYAGDSVALLADDYGRRPEEIEEALRYESRAAS
jgi:uncharacterized protein (DUF433 family)